MRKIYVIVAKAYYKPTEESEQLVIDTRCPQIVFAKKEQAIRTMKRQRARCTKLYGEEIVKDGATELMGEPNVIDYFETTNKQERLRTTYTLYAITHIHI